jgi:phosphatidylinositol alpha-1,6-mannosyltransferase
MIRDLHLTEHVRCLGATDELTKWAAYELCDVFVMPSRVLSGLDWEGFGIVFLEAALAGRPAIGGRTGGTADAIDDQVTGLLVDPEAPGALTQTIRRLLNDPDLRQRLGRAGEEAARNTYRADAAVGHMRTQLGWN